MNHAAAGITAFALAAGLLAAGIAAEPAHSDPLEDLSQAQLQEAFRVLSEHYIERDNLGYEQLNKAALDGLLRRLSFGAELVPRNDGKREVPAGISFHEEIVADGVAYLRPVTFDEGEVSRSAKAVRGYGKAGIATLILDLRAPVEQVEFARAAAFADLFTEPNKLLFKIRKPGDTKARLFLSKAPRLWKDRLFVLIDRDTSSVAETVAAVLQRENENCVFIGERTIGKAVQYEEVALNQSTALRFASAQVLLPDDSSLFRKGVSPNLRSVTASPLKKRIFAASTEKGMASFVFDRVRPRMNEAALVAGFNPELDYYLAKSLGKASPFDRVPLQDRALQTAVESLLAIDFLVLPVAEKKPGPPAAKEKESASDNETPPGKDDPSPAKGETASPPDASPPRE